jgi:hypothetical protein
MMVASTETIIGRCLSAARSSPPYTRKAPVVLLRREGILHRLEGLAGEEWHEDSVCFDAALGDL